MREQPRQPGSPRCGTRRIGQVLAWLHGNPQEPWTVSSLAKRLGISRSAFAARFKEFVGQAPLQYLRHLQLNAAAARLISSDDTLIEVAPASGYKSVPLFVVPSSGTWDRHPGEYRTRPHSSRAE
jgi:AraC-like DNA-binding protein